MKKQWIRICCALLVLCCIVTGVTGCAGSEKDVQKPAAVPTKKIQPREGLQNILVFCVDEVEKPQDNTAYRNGKFVDLLLVFLHFFL